VNSENIDLRAQFEATASTYRRRKLQLQFALVPLLLVWFGLLFYRGPAVVLAITFLVFTAGVIIGQRALPKLICPACKRASDCEPVRFCPECGSGKLQKKGEDKYFLTWARCQACGKQLSVRKGGRRYRIRFCTRCGGYLDETGL
jgi:rRNA maturation endonuclease Nob1